MLRDPALTTVARQRALIAIDAVLPPEIRDARTAASKPAELHLRVEALRAAGGSSEEIAAARRSEYGAGAAERLALLDGQRAQWSERLTRYRGEVQALCSSHGGADSPAYRKALEAPRQRRFSSGELLRVRALDAETS